MHQFGFAESVSFSSCFIYLCGRQLLNNAFDNLYLPNWVKTWPIQYILIFQLKIDFVSIVALVLAKSISLFLYDVIGKRYFCWRPRASIFEKGLFVFWHRWLQCLNQRVWLQFRKLWGVGHVWGGGQNGEWNVKEGRGLIFPSFFNYLFFW